MLTVYLIRHAESQGNVDHHLIGGQSNHFPLTEQGVVQAHRLGQRLQAEGCQFDLFFASPAVRAQHTAAIVAQAIGFDPAALQTDARLVELSQGDWEGLVRSDIFTPALKAEIATQPLDFAAPGGESQRQVADRMQAWLETALDQAATSGAQHIAALSHGFAIKCLIARLFQVDPLQTRHLVTHNTSLTVIEQAPSGWLLDRLNDHTHIIGTPFIGHYG